VEIREHVVQPAPTWSWFSVPIYAFHQLNFLVEDEVSAKRKSDSATPTVCFDNIFWATMVSFWFSSQPVSHFPDSGNSDFDGLRVTLSAKTLPVSIDLAADIISP
jgi:hypothetical protein